MILTIYTDGASRGNPGKSSYGFVVLNEDKEVIYEEGKYLGINTNNFAEHTAVLRAFEYLRAKHSPKTLIKFFMDSKLVAEQLSGRFKIKSTNLIPIIEKVKEIEDRFMEVTYSHVPRSMNTLADAQANKALDSLR